MHINVIQNINKISDFASDVQYLFAHEDGCNLHSCIWLFYEDAVLRYSTPVPYNINMYLALML